MSIKELLPSEVIDVRALTEKDIDAVNMLDTLAVQDICSMIDCAEFAWGIFYGDDLVGYCTLGYADCTDCSAIESYPGYSEEALLLSDVFIVPDSRFKGFGKRLVKEAIRKKSGSELVFLIYLEEWLVSFYARLGFEVLAPGIMVRNRRTA